ncbi:MAG TPA: NADP-dependent oxidoreductase [Acidobacteriota bacterium]|nr:NADP-dependent oxidoreductase [Acidobacteriota bacterium]
MSPTVPKTMKAAVIDKFGGPGVLRVARIPVPEPRENEILIRVHTAGIGSWDPWVREGGLGGKTFPQVIGSDGSGTVVAAGSKVRRLKPGDKVYAYAFENAKGGFYAEYAAVPEDAAAPVPGNVSMAEAGGLAACGLTALAGLDTLAKVPATALLVLGASGGVGHIALQLAKRRGARILAVASQRDGVSLAESLGADRAVDGRAAGIAKAAREFAPGGFDAALVFANSARLSDALRLVRKGGVIAYPEGVEPVPRGSAGVKVVSFNGLSDPGAFARLNALVAGGPFRVAIGGAYGLEALPQAHRDVLRHHLGKLIVKPK